MSSLQIKHTQYTLQGPQGGGGQCNLPLFFFQCVLQNLDIDRQGRTDSDNYSELRFVDSKFKNLSPAHIHIQGGRLLSICLSVYLSICVSVYLSICLSVYLSNLSIYLSLYLTVCLHVSIYICLFSVCLFEYIWLYLTIYSSAKLSICLTVYLSIYLYLCLSIYLPIFLSIYLFVFLPVCLLIFVQVYLSIYLSFLRDILFELIQNKQNFKLNYEISEYVVKLRLSV